MTGNTNTFAQRHRWLMMTAGLVLMTAAFAAHYYAHSFIQEQATTMATAALRSIQDETQLKLTKIEMAADALVPQIEQHLDNADTMFCFSQQILEENKAIKGCSVSFEPNFFKDKGRYFSAYSYSGGQKMFTEQEGDDDYQYFYMDWYLIPQQLNKKYWIEPYEETIKNEENTKVVMTTYTQPLHNQNDSIVGILSVDVPLKWLSDIILAEHPLPQSYCMLLGRGGAFIVHPDHKRLLYETILTPTLEGNNPDLMKLGRAMISGETGTQMLKKNGQDTHVFYTPFGRTGWSLALVCPDRVLMLNYYILSWILITLMVIGAIVMLTPLWCHLNGKKSTASLLLIGAMLLTACQENIGIESLQGKSSTQTEWTDTLLAMSERGKAENQQMLALLDSLENNKVISSQEANYWRGSCYEKLEQMRPSILYLKKATDGDALYKENSVMFNTALLELAVAYFNSNDLENSLKVASRGYKLARNDSSSNGQINTLSYLEKIGNCQISLGHFKEADNTYKMVKEGIEQMIHKYASDNDIQESCLLMGINIINMYMNKNRYDALTPWYNFVDKQLERYAATNAAMKYYESYLSMIWVNKAIMLFKTKHPEEAETAFQKFLDTDYAKTYNGLYEQAYYYQYIERWDKLLNVRKKIDTLINKNESNITLSSLINEDGTTFQALYKTGHKEEALQKAISIMNRLDTVNTNESRNNAAELAVIYETQQKEQKIAQQQASLTKQWYVTTAIVFGLVTLAFTIILLLRHRAAKRLEAAHEKLLVAYDQLEETTTAKERIESELRIARDIQMSMVPRTFPEREGLEMYAEMTPAREVGGDLYDYLMQDDQLYFCVGDVSGKGVPASLFMAQTIRLFRALAKQHQMPVNIANELNEELSANNDSGMFVTMFIGLLDLKTGYLNYCNAGHNPPILGGDEHGGSFLKMESNAPIGLWEHLKYIGEEINTIKGRPLFIYTDGLNEAENKQRQQLGDERMLSILQDTRYKSPTQVINTLKAAVDEHRQGAEPNDDLTMMCIKIR